MEHYEDIDNILEQYPSDKRYMMNVLHKLQDTYGFVSSNHVKKIAEYFGLSMANVFSEITFYDKFTTKKQGEIVFQICDGTVCHTKGSQEILKDLEDKLGIKVGETTPDGKYSLQTVRCMGECSHAPVAAINETTCAEIKGEDLDSVIDEKQSIVNLNSEKNLYKVSILKCKYDNKLLQVATSIDDYIARGGFSGLKRAMSFTRRRMILEEIKKSGLRGRSGSGFLVGSKWEAAYNAKGRSSNFIDKYIIANGDEGDPGAFMDKWIMENNPYMLLEGIVIAGLCTNANKGYIYVRDEYPTAVVNLVTALGEMQKRSVVGRNILGSDYSFDIEIVRAGRSYVCGEESALIESIEGKPGIPRIKPPFPTYRGVMEQPTLLNNIETFANVPIVLSETGETYRKTGTSNNTGTKIFSLSGAVKNKGLVEIPMGEVTLRELIYDIGGGVDSGELKCVQVGGPLGSYIPGDRLDIALDFDSFAKNGYMLGSGGIVVINDLVEPTDLIRHSVEFLSVESCGTCTPCREGLRVLIDIAERLSENKIASKDMELIKKISSAAKIASRCALGKTIGNPILSILEAYDFIVEDFDETGGEQIC